MESGDSDQENNNSNLLHTTQERKICYRDLLNKLEGIEESDDLGLGAIKAIGNVIKQVNSIELAHNIQKRYQYPEETLLDHMVLSTVSNVLLKCIESVDVNMQTYVPSDFATKIIENCCEEEDEFEDEMLLKLLPEALNLIPQVPEYKFTYGTYDLQNLPIPKQKKERQKQSKDKFEKKEPEKVTKVQKEEDGIDETVKLLQDVLNECYEQNNNNPIRYFDYIVDTSSFSNTVENMFYCSFLIRDGKAHIDLDQRGVPYIKPIKKRALKEFRQNGGINSQIIAINTISKWETFKKDGYIQQYKARMQ